MGVIRFFKENKIVQTTMARSCFVHKLSNYTAGGKEDAYKRPTDNVAAWYEEDYDWFE